MLHQQLEVQLAIPPHHQRFQVQDSLVQFTPDQSDWDGMNAKTALVSSVVDHSPDGVTWVKSWPAWDGKVLNLTGMANIDIQNSICTGGIIKGTKAVYYERPFADAKKPTKAEVDDLHIRTIRHLRKMVGIDKIVPIEFDRCLCSIALWSEQLNSTPSLWKDKYPNATCFAAGHCDFVPNAVDQVLTFGGEKNTQVCNSYMSSAEGIGSTNADIPWSLKFHRTVCQFLGEGTSGHPGPLFRRTKLCPNFYWAGATNGATIRIKSGGSLFTKLYWD